MTIDITPVPKPRMTQSDRWKKRPAVLRYRAFSDQLREAYADDLPSKVEMLFFMPMPQSWSTRKKLEMDGQPHQQRPDIDNLMKAVMDSLCEEDSYIHTVRASKYWSPVGHMIINRL